MFMSYIIDREPQKLVFVHIPKTAGQSIYSVFEDNCIHVPNDRTSNSNYHSTLKDIENFTEIENYKIFTVVRNPWSRTASWYFFRKKILRLSIKRSNSNKSVDKIDFNNLKDPVKEYELMSDFNLWLHRYICEPWDFTWFSLADPQSHWLESKNSVDQIFKFESLSADFKAAFDIDLPKKNQSSASSILWRDMYSKKGKKLIEKYYQEDIDRFNYTFN